MAQFHLTTKVISRKAGQSAIAAAAYRSGKELVDEQTGEIKDYSRRAARVIFEGIFAPADAPAWARDRQQLWNHVERNETRKDSRLAREIEMALPHEMTDAQREGLLKDFIREQLTRKGLVVDAAIHAPEEGKDQRNYHAHLLITTRTVGRDGFAATIDLEQKSVAALQHWREQWAHLSNRHLERHGYAARIDHRSLEAQGVVREPTIHLGYAACEMAARGQPSDRVDELKRIVERNDAIRFSERLAQSARKFVSGDRAQGATLAPAPAFDTSKRPVDFLEPETPQQIAARELREQQSVERAELKARQKAERDALAKELRAEMDNFRRQSRGAYGKQAAKAFADTGEQFKAQWKELYKTTPKEKLAEAKAALAAQQREALAERRKQLFAATRDIRAASWEQARDVQSAARRALREEHKAQWKELEGRQFEGWQRSRASQEKDSTAQRRGPAVLMGSMAATQTALLDYLAQRAAQQQRDAQRRHDRFADAAHGRKDQLAGMARTGQAESAARREVTDAPRRDSPNRAEAATAQRLASGKEFTEAFRAFVARENSRPKTERDLLNSSEKNQTERGGRDRNGGGRGGRER
jgi:hypothetical protein